MRERAGSVTRGFPEDPDYVPRQGIPRRLAINGSDVRILTLEHSRDTADNGAHAGDAFSAPLAHMLHNTGAEEMKVVCFFGPGTSPDDYRLETLEPSRLL